MPDLFLLGMIALTIAKSMLARSIAIDPAVAAGGLWLDAGIATFLFAGAALVFRKRSHLLLLGIYAVYSFVLFGDAIYAKFFDQMLDPQMIGLAGQTGEIGDIILDLLKPVYLWFFIDIPVFALWAILLRRRHAVYKRKGVAIATPVACAVVLAQIALVTAAPAGTDSTTTATQWGITAMQLASIKSMAFPQEKHAFADIAAGGSGAAGSKAGTETAAQQAMRLFNSRMGEYAPTGGTRIAPFPEGACKGKNVIIIEFESLQRMFIDAKVNGQEVTPNVNRFLKECYDFPNAYSETGIGNTADTEFTLATSMLAAMQQNSTSAYADRVIPALPRMLGDRGYRTITLHTNDAHFWFRTDLYAALGYQKYYDKSYFKDRDQMWRGSSDEVLFEDGMKALKKELRGGKPLLATFVTMTSHVGYGFPVGQTRRPLKLPPKYANSYAGKYAGAISYADKAFGQFIDDLKAAGLYDDTVIVLFGDHMGYKIEDPTPTDDAIIRQMLGRDMSYADHQRVAFAVHVPHQKPKVIRSMRAIQDVMPTVADLAGVDISTTPHFGRSVFVEGPRLVPFRAYFPGGSYVDNNIVFVAGSTEGSDEAFDIQTNKQIKAPSRRDSKLAMVRQFNALSDEWLMSLPVRDGAVNRRRDAPAASEESE